MRRLFIRDVPETLDLAGWNLFHISNELVKKYYNVKNKKKYQL